MIDGDATLHADGETAPRARHPLARGPEQKRKIVPGRGGRHVASPRRHAGQGVRGAKVLT